MGMKIYTDLLMPSSLERIIKNIISNPFGYVCVFMIVMLNCVFMIVMLNCVFMIVIFFIQKSPEVHTSAL